MRGHICEEYVSEAYLSEVYLIIEIVGEGMYGWQLFHNSKKGEGP